MLPWVILECVQAGVCDGRAQDLNCSVSQSAVGQVHIGGSSVLQCPSKVSDHAHTHCALMKAKGLNVHTRIQFQA